MINQYSKLQIRNARNLGFELGEESIFQGFADLEKTLKIAGQFLS